MAIETGEASDDKDIQCLGRAEKSVTLWIDDQPDITRQDSFCLVLPTEGQLSKRMLMIEIESEMVEKLSTCLSRHIVPLFIKGTNRPHLCGSGLLVSASTGAFLISAAHVFDELRFNEGFYYVDPKGVLKVTGQFRLTKIPKGKTREDDILDVGVLKLEGPGLPPYPAVDKYPLPVDYILPNALPREGKTYLVVGFPSTQSRVNPVHRNIASRVYGFHNISHPIDKYGRIGVAPETHIAIIFERKGSVGPDGKPRWFPNPHGLSGSPVFLLYDHQELDDQKLEEQIPNEPKPVVVVGIAIEHRKHQNAIVATDIGSALAMINDAI